MIRKMMVRENEEGGGGGEGQIKKNTDSSSE
jgi:hypothetical protein